MTDNDLQLCEYDHKLTELTKEIERLNKGWADANVSNLKKGREYEAEIERLQRLNEQSQMQLTKLRQPTLVAENKRLREALEMIATGNTWHRIPDNDARYSSGGLARAALKQEKRDE